MERPARLFASVVAALITVPLVALSGATTARACSCAAIDPLDAVAFADVVFTGSAVANEGTEFEPVWRFDVDGVVKGEVEPVEIVTGDDWGVGCGTDFGQFRQPIVVFAGRSGDRLNAIGCMPTPTADAFAAQLAAITEPTGTGAPEVVMVGTYGLSDIAVLDGRGRTIGRAELGLTGGAVAHCPGTTRVAVVSTDSSQPMAIVDLATLEVVDRRPIRSGFISVTGDRVACFDAGDHVVTTTGYGPDTGSVVVAVSTSEASGADDVDETFGGVSRAVIHRAGTVLLLPTTVGDPVRARSATDLEPVGTDVALPDGASALDADVSPDGSTLAVLATLSGRPVEWNTAATHVITIDLVDGVPVADSATVVALTSTGDDIEVGIGASDGAAKWIRWVDAGTWVVEYETDRTKKFAFVATDGTELLAPTDVGWGWGLVALEAGVLRASEGGLEVIALDGTSTDGDPAPSDSYIDRILALDRLVDAPPFEFPAAPTEPLTITPVAVATGDRPEPSPEPTPEPDEPDVVPEPDEGAAPEPDVVVPLPTPPSDSGSGVIAGSRDRSARPWLVGGALVLAALAVAGAVAWRRRTVGRTAVAAGP